ncbi:MAG: sulfatase-like hydrolase/transferase [Pyrinomonadaceae bacterium]|nr:sulfatase-like hydrolase/transferase [Pyrinomonadaceae bacterium]
MENSGTEQHENRPFRLGLIVQTVAVTVSLVVFELIFLPRTRSGFGVLYRHFESGNVTRFAVSLALSAAAIAIFGLFVHSALSSGIFYKILYLVVFAVVTFTQFGYYSALGGFATRNDLEIAMFAVNSGVIANSVKSYFSFLSLIPVIYFAVAVFSSNARLKSAMLRLVAVSLLLITFNLVSTYFTSNTFYVHSFSSGLRTLVSIPVVWSIGTYNEPPRNRYYGAERDLPRPVPNEPEKNVVLIVDESVRADHLSINGYKKPTTGALDGLSQDGYLRNWGIAVSGTTCSVTSNALLLTGVRVLPDLEYKTLRQPTLFQFARASGFRVHYLDGQANTFWNGKPRDVRDYGSWTGYNELKSAAGHVKDIDREIARRIKKIVSTSTGNFIFITKYGLHQSHIHSYETGGDSEIEKYDRALKYNSDSFFGELLDASGPDPNTIYLYTSDHGRNFDDSVMKSTHCGPTKAEATVPLLLIAARNKLPVADVSYRASHSNIFATVLDLLGYPKSQRKYDYALSLLKAKATNSTTRTYYVGDLYDKNAGKRLVFDGEESE